MKNKLILTILVLVATLFFMVTAKADLSANVTDITVNVAPDSNVNSYFTLVSHSPIVTDVSIWASTEKGLIVSFDPANITQLNTSQTIRLNVAADKYISPGLKSLKVHYKWQEIPTKKSQTLSHFEGEFPLYINVTTNAAFSLSTTELIIKAQQGETQKGKFIITNNGNVALTNIVLANDLKLDDGNGHTITLSFTSPGTINPGNSSDVNVTATISSSQKLKVYSGTVNVTANGILKQFTLKVVVQPEVCSDGNLGDLTVDIRNPSENERFNPGETINVEAKIENTGNDDLDIGITALLYDKDTGDTLVEQDSDVVLIRNDRTNTFEVELKVPVSELDTEDSYAVYVKAFEDGNEDENCRAESQDIDIETVDDDVIIDDVVFNPVTAKCGDTVTATMYIYNVGNDKQTNVYAVLRNSALGIDQQTTNFDIKGITSTYNEQIETMTFTLPATAEDGTYDIETAVYFGSDKFVDSYQLTLSGCKNVEKVHLTVPETEYSVEIGNVINVPVTIKNLAVLNTNYVVEAVAVGGWADTQTNNFTLSSNEEKTIYFNVEPKKDTTSGDYTLSIRVKSGNTVLKESSINVNLRESTTQEEGKFIGGLDLGSLFGGSKGLSTAAWLLVDFVLLLIALLILKAIFKH